MINAHPILIVDDQEDHRFSISLILEEQGYVTCEAADGPTALDILRNKDIALVLLDYTMPKMDGLTVLRQIRSFDTFLPVIMVTAYGTGDLGAQFIRKGGNDFIAKPIVDEGLLISKVERAIEFAQAKKEADSKDKQLRDSQARIQQIMTNASNGIITIDENEAIVEFNAAIESMFGYTSEELLGKNIKMLLHPLYYRRFSLASISRIERREATFMKKDRSTITVEITVSYADVNGKRFYTGFLQDISKRNKAERKLKMLNKELLNLNASKDLFLSILSHDIKNPFGGVLSSLAMLSHHSRDFSPEDLEQRLAVLYDSAKNVYRYFENTLTWSALQQGRMECIRERCDAAIVIGDIVAVFTEQANAKDILVDNTIASPTTIYADQDMLSHAVSNLVGNAIKFTEPGGSVRLTSTSSKGFLHVTVSDTGVGLTEDEMSKLFRIDVSPTEIGDGRNKGTGLGLVLCKALVELNGGTISVDSQKWVGTGITITIPTAPPADTP